MASAFQLLHFGVQRQIWEMKWPELRPIQTHAIEHLLGGGGDCVIASPTASGKTEAAFLPIVSRIAEDSQGGVRAMYVGPLKALINDQFGRIEELCKRLDLPVHKWHGDVGDAERRALLDHPSGILLITPESLEAMFVLRPTRMPAIFGRLSYVVVDELHAFIGSVRGAQLQSQLYRLRARCNSDPVRVGLSATLAEPELACQWLRPDGVPATLIDPDSPSSELKLRVRGFWRDSPDTDAVSESEDDASVVEVSRAILQSCKGHTNLVFANAKRRIEQLADELKTQAEVLGVRDEIVVHHGSLSREQREYAEQRLKSGQPCTAVCTNTLELGIDIGAIDCVVQVDAPWSVASLMQRLGRSGRRPGQARILRGFLIADRATSETDFWDRLQLGFIQALAVIELTLAKEIEPPRVDRSHRSTMVHQLLSTVAETGGIPAAPLYDRLTKAHAFGPLSKASFAALLRELARHDVISQMADGTLVLGLKGQRLVEHYTFYAAFQGASELRVIHNGDQIGMLPEFSVPPPGEHLILAGRRWQVRDVDVERREVVVVPSVGRKAPWFASSPGELHPAVHLKMRELLRTDRVPAYLDDLAKEILADARGTARSSNGFRPALQPATNGTRLFVFGGSRVQHTLFLVLSGAGLKLRSCDVGFDIEASPDVVRATLATFAASTDDGIELAAFAEEKMNARLDGEKFDRFLPSDIWRSAFVNDQLDLAAARALARVFARKPRSTLLRKPGDGLSVVCGLALDGTSLTEADDLAPGEAVIGQAHFGPRALLRDLEMRLGLAHWEIPFAVRAARWSARVARVARERFYAASHDVDAWGTAVELLRWRDELVLAGWDGARFEAGGERLDALAELNAMQEPSLPAGDGDRLAAVHRALVDRGVPVYERLRLVEPMELWPSRWRDVLAQLQANNCSIERYLHSVELAPENSDLGRMQRHDFQNAIALTGDGTLVRLRAETPLEAAHASAALLRAVASEDECVVVRSGDPSPLEAALVQQGFAGQGLRVTTNCRPLLQVLSLAIELAFEPKDPFRVLELLLMHEGPMQGSVGRKLATALAERTGFGTLWQSAKADVAESIRQRCQAQADADGLDRAVAAREAEVEVAAKLKVTADWIEEPGCVEAEAPRAALQVVAGRVLAWLASRCAIAPDDPIPALALAHARAFGDALADDPRARLDIVQARQLLDTIVGRGCTLEITPEAAGRVDHVAEPAALLCSRDTVLWWNCADSSASLPRGGYWSRAEREALSRNGIKLVDDQELLSATAEGWRRALLAARCRLVIVEPRVSAGVQQQPHPFVDELAARTTDPTHGLDPITLTPRQLLERTGGVTLPRLRLSRVESLPLPEPRATWRIDPSLVASTRDLSATSLEALLGCPLRWVLAQHAGLYASRSTVIPTGRLLYGALGHRLIEEMHRATELKLPLDDLDRHAHARLEALVNEEAMPLRMPGTQSELAQLRDKLVASVRSLALLLDRARLVIESVEHESRIDWRGRKLQGRTDLVLRGPDGRAAIVDLKWGRSDYEERLREGRALQLATYAFIQQQLSGLPEFPAVAYFSLGRGAILTTEAAAFGGTHAISGDGARDTWRRAEATAAKIERLVGTGAIPVAGVAGARPIVECADGSVDAADAFHIEPDEACKYCHYDVICGRRWERA